MKDNDVKNSLQEAAQELARRFPGRAFALFVMKSEPDQRAHYVANAKRSEIIKALDELKASGLPGIPADDETAN